MLGLQSHISFTLKEVEVVLAGHDVASFGEFTQGDLEAGEALMQLSVVRNLFSFCSSLHK